MHRSFEGITVSSIADRIESLEYVGPAAIETTLGLPPAGRTGDRAALDRGRWTASVVIAATGGRPPIADGIPRPGATSDVPVAPPR